jgi:hypothetical protein
VVETPSGARTVSVVALGLTVESYAKAFERFIGPDHGPDLVCPACEGQFDPSTPYIAPRWQR